MTTDTVMELVEKLLGEQGVVLNKETREKLEDVLSDFRDEAWTDGQLVVVSGGY